MNIKCFILILLVVSIVFASGCAEISVPPESLEEPTSGDIKTEEKIPSQETPAASPINLELSLSKPPALKDIAEIKATITYVGKIKENMPETIANIILPSSFELVSGNLTWKGELKTRIDFSVMVRTTKVGDWTIEGNVRSPSTGDTYFGGRDFIYITVLEDNAIISETPFPKPTEPCVDRIIDGELIQCTTPEPTGDFVETGLP